MRTYGYVKSIPSAFDTEYKGNPGVASSYNVSQMMGPVRDQGNTPKCVSVALTDMIEWDLNYSGAKLKEQDSVFFKNRPDKSMDGMTPRDAFQFARMQGVSTSDGIYKINSYAKVTSIDSAKSAIIAKGPIMACLLVKSFDTLFWRGSSTLGGHAVLLTGYDSEGFTLRNSWGISYGSSGYTILPYSDFDKVIESWVILS